MFFCAPGYLILRAAARARRRRDAKKRRQDVRAVGLGHPPLLALPRAREAHRHLRADPSGENRQRPSVGGRACDCGASAHVRSAAMVKRLRQYPSCRVWRSSSSTRSRVAAALQNPGRSSALAKQCAPVEWLQLLQGGCSTSLAMEGWTMPHHRCALGLVGGLLWPVAWRSWTLRLAFAATDPSVAPRLPVDVPS